MPNLLQRTHSPMWVDARGLLLSSWLWRRLTPVPVSSPPVAASPPKPHPLKIPAKITAYTIGIQSTGKAPGDPGYGITSSGVEATPGVTVAAPHWVPYGTRVKIPGYGVGIVQDRGGAIHGHHFDICVSSVSQAYQWGVQHLTISLVFPARA